MTLELILILLFAALICSAVAADEAAVAELPGALIVAHASEGKFRFAAPRPEPGQGIYLALRARIENTGTTITGSYFSFTAAINGRVIDGPRLVNKGPTYRIRNGWEFDWHSAGMWRTHYHDSFTGYDAAGDRPEDVMTGQPFEFVFDITGLADKTVNELTIRNTLPGSVPLPVVMDQVCVESRPMIVRTQTHRVGVVPAGPLTVYLPAQRYQVDYALEIGVGGGMVVSVGGERYAINSSFTHPGGGRHRLADGSEWNPRVTRVGDRHFRVEADGDYYRLVRDVLLRDEHVDVHDTFTSLSGDDVPIWLRHELRLPARPTTTYLCGNAGVEGKCEAHFPENPAIYVSQGRAGLAMLSRDDVMRVQSVNFTEAPAGDGLVVCGIQNRRFCLAAGASRTLRWSIFPTRQDDYWSYVNAARRVLGVNFTLPGSFVFLYTRPQFYDKPRQAKRAYVHDHALYFGSSGIAEYQEDGRPATGARFAHGTGLTGAPQWIQRTAAMLADFKAASPSLRSLVYFHCYISTEPQAPEKYADSRQIDHAGKPVNYDYDGGDKYPAFYPTLDNSYGRSLPVYFDIAFDQIKADGVYWDEVSESGVVWTYTDQAWDGVSCDIDPTGFTLARRCSSVNLLSQPWRAATMKRLLTQGKAIVGNSMPFTETETSIHFPRFVETCPISMLHKTHLYTPIGLGDGVLDEKMQDDVNRHIRMHVDRGALYYYYNGAVELTHPNLTSKMYPFTPVEIRPGVLIGRERIIVSVPGVFGWGDGVLPASVHVFDERGVEVNGSEWVAFDPAGGTTSLRLPSGFTAALVR